MAPPPSISSRAKACLDLFQKCLSKLQTHTEGHQAGLLVENQEGSFRIWAHSIGIFGHPRGSLDTRLRDAPEDRDILLDLIDTLFSHLQHRKYHISQY